MTQTDRRYLPKNLLLYGLIVPDGGDKSSWVLRSKYTAQVVCGKAVTDRD